MHTNSFLYSISIQANSSHIGPSEGVQNILNFYTPSGLFLNIEEVLFVIAILILVYQNAGTEQLLTHSSVLKSTQL